ncbi:hypothetical protein [Streptomyces sp. NPDC101234]|uniref:hypothetical protein n=1 Tax=Streptomyces sp. NPDC101234 TaxID=3366138 RepID=UPI00380FEE07
MPVSRERRTGGTGVFFSGSSPAPLRFYSGSTLALLGFLSGSPDAAAWSVFIDRRPNNPEDVPEYEYARPSADHIRRMR